MYRRIAMAIKTACFLGVFVDCCLFACCPADCWGDTEQVVAQSGVQWLPEQPWTCPIGRCQLYCSGAAPWPLKRPADEVHLFATTAFLIAEIVA
jgi:hypothetical protein